MTIHDDRNGTTPPYAYRFELDEAVERIERNEERTDALISDTRTIIDEARQNRRDFDAFSRDVFAAFARIEQRLGVVDAKAERASGTNEDALELAGKALATVQPMVAVAAERKSESMRARAENRRGAWKAVLTTVGWLTVGGGAFAIASALADRCGG